MVTSRPERPRTPARVLVYTAVVCAVTVAGLVLAWRWGRFPEPEPLIALLLLYALVWWVGDILVESHVSLSLLGVVLLASAVILGPVGAGVFGLAMAALTRQRIPASARLFNMAMVGLIGVAGALAYLLAGGRSDITDVVGPGPLLREVAVPLLVADIVQAVLNVALVVGIVRLAQGIPIRLQAKRMILSSGAVYLGYGVLAFVLVVLWLPAGLGPVSVLLLLVPLFGAQWALAQYSAHVASQEAALEVLVAAIDAHQPARAGRSALVADLAARTAEHLGLGVAEVADVRRAGLLHDLDRVAVPTVPAPGARMLQGLTFLDGAAALLRPEDGGSSPHEPVGRAVVHAAAELEELLHHEGAALAAALDEVALWAPSRVSEALAWAVERTPGLLTGSARRHTGDGAQP